MQEYDTFITQAKDDLDEPENRDTVPPQIKQPSESKRLNKLDAAKTQAETTGNFESYLYIYKKKIRYTVCLEEVFAVYPLLYLDAEWFYLYSSGVLHWLRGNHSLPTSLPVRF